MIKPNEKSKVTSFRNDDVTKNKIDIEIIKHDIQTIKETTKEHNNKTDKEFTQLHKKIDRLDGRLWAVAGLIIATTVGKMLSDWMM